MAPRSTNLQKSGRRLILDDASDQPKPVWVRSRTELLQAASSSEARCNQLHEEVEKHQSDLVKAFKRSEAAWKDAADAHQDMNEMQWRMTADRVLDWIEMTLLSMSFNEAQPRIQVANAVYSEMERFVGEHGLWSAMNDLFDEIGMVVVVVCRLSLSMPRPNTPLYEPRERGLTHLAEIQSEGHSDVHSRLLFLAANRLRLCERPALSTESDVPTTDDSGQHGFDYAGYADHIS